MYLGPVYFSIHIASNFVTSTFRPDARSIEPICCFTCCLVTWHFNCAYWRAPCSLHIYVYSYAIPIPYSSLSSSRASSRKKGINRLTIPLLLENVYFLDKDEWISLAYKWTEFNLHAYSFAYYGKSIFLSSIFCPAENFASLIRFVIETRHTRVEGKPRISL